MAFESLNNHEVKPNTKNKKYVPNFLQYSSVLSIRYLPIPFPLLTYQMILIRENRGENFYRLFRVSYSFSSFMTRLKKKNMALKQGWGAGAGCFWLHRAGAA